MNEESQSMDGQASDQVTDAASSGIGASLQQAREALNISIEHAAHELHLDVRLLTAIESDDFSALPGTAYAYGYLRSYAKLLKISEEEVLQKFLQMTQIDSNALVPEHMTFAEKNKVPSFSFRQTVLLTIFVIAVVASIAWVLLADVLDKFTADNEVSENVELIATEIVDEPVSPDVDVIPVETLSIEEKQQDAIPDSTQVKHVEATPASTPTKALRLTFQADSWTEVRDASSETLIYRMVKEGESLELEGKAPYVILLGYAPGVSVSYKDTVFDTKPYQRDDIAYFRIGQKAPVSATE